MHCHNHVRLNWQAFWNIIIAIAVAAVLGILIDKIYSFDSILFDLALYVFAAYVPILFGQQLFLKENNEKKVCY